MFDDVLDRGKVNDVSWCFSVANKVVMIFGEITFANVVEILTNPVYQTIHPVGISISRAAAMVTSLSREKR